MESTRFPFSAAFLSGRKWALAAALILLTGPPLPAGTATTVPGTILTDTTWTAAGNPYLVGSDVLVAPGATLTIQAGVQVRFNGNYALSVQGAMKAIGTAEQPVLFRSNQPIPAPGDWSVLDFRAESRGSRLEHVVLEYGGNATRTGWYCAAGALCVNTSSFWMEASTVRYSATRGAVLAQSNATLYRSRFDGNALEGIRLHSCDLSLGECHPRIVGNQFQNNRHAMLLDNAQLPEMSGNTATGNLINGLVLNPQCNLKGTNTFYADDLPYVVPGYGDWCHIGTYNSATRLTIQPGTVFKLLGTIQFWYDTTVSALGTEDRPIIFTSLRDDSVGGDTNNDGNASSPAEEDWGTISHVGTAVAATYDHVLWRYGGNTDFGWGPLVKVQDGAGVIIRNSELTRAEVGIYTYRNAALDLQKSRMHHLLTAGLDTYATGTVLVAGNRFTDIGSAGILVRNGSPVIQENFFQGNPGGVKVICSVHPCSPVVSPHNRFVGSDQTGVEVSYPQSVCIDARQNGWGDISGPRDTSTATDACGVADNPGGSGAKVSNGVRYSPWEGGMGRPVLATPRCGVTALTQPVLSGGAPTGAVVSFYDSGLKIGETTAGANDTFSWTPAAPLTDGTHALTAIASWNNQVSLPTPAVALRVNSLLPFDPMGVRIRYDFHGVPYLQVLRDAQGCSSTDARLETPVWVRPGTSMTVSVPVRRPGSRMARLGERRAESIHFPGQTARKEMQSGYAPQREVTVQNNSAERIVGYRVAAPSGNPGNRIYSGYGPETNIPGGIAGGAQGTIQVEGNADVVLVTADGALLRVDGNIGDAGFGGINVPSGSRSAELTLHNRTSMTLFPVYFGKPAASGKDYFGGTNLSLGLESNKDEPIRLPASATADTDYYALASGFADGSTIYYPVKIHLPAGRDAQVTFEGSYGEVDITNGFAADVCHFGLAPFADQQGGAGDKPLNLLQILDSGNPSPKIAGGGSLSRIRVGTGKYYWQAYYCNGTLAGHGVVDISTIHRGNLALPLRLECQNKVRIGPDSYPLQKKQIEYSVRSGDFFDEYEATFPMSTGPLSFQICDQGYLRSQPLGDVLIDPDGFVYNARLGLAAVLKGITVTCKKYDEDYQTWIRWPAELFENQINPQVTGTDGYYAFFVPPGLYRIEAGAAGYFQHTSPNIEVIDEVVHYNVPLIPAPVCLPLIRK